MSQKERTTRDRTTQRNILWGILAVAVAIRLWHIGWGLPELYDEAVPLRYSWPMWNWSGEGLDLNPHFFTYPGFTLYLQFILQSLQYFIGHLLGYYPDMQAFQQSYANPSPFIIIGRVTTILFDLGTIVVLYQLGSRWRNRNTGLLAAGLAAVNPLLIKQSLLINVDTPLTFFVGASILLMYMVYKEPATRGYILAGVAIGLAAATKYNGALLLVVLLTAHLLRSTSVSHALRSLTDRRLIGAFLVSGAVFAVWNPYIVLRFQDFWKDMFEIRMHMELGGLGIDKGQSTAGFYFLDSIPRSLGWPPAIAAIGGCVYFLYERKKTNWIVAAFPILYLVVLCTFSMRADRYVLPAVPFLILFGAAGVWMLWEKMKTLAMRRGGIAVSGPAFAILLGVIVFSMPLHALYRYHRSLSLPDTRALAKEWIETHLPSGSTVATGPFGISLEKNYVVLPIPFNAGYTEKTIPYYDPQWYEDLDLVITSDYDYNRYKQQPERLGEILRFYDTLRTRWTLAGEITPAEGQEGSTFWLYRPPGAKRALFNPETIERLKERSDTAEAINFLGKLGMILSFKGRTEKSAQVMREVLSLDPGNIRALRAYAEAEVQLQQFDDALPALEQILKQYPDDAEMTAMEGDVLLQLQRFDEAEPCLLRALQLNKHLASVYLDLSLLYGMQNQTSRIIDILTRYLEILPPNGNETRLVQAEIDRLKKT